MKENLWVILMASWKVDFSATSAWAPKQSHVPEELFPKLGSACENTYCSHHSLDIFLKILLILRNFVSIYLFIYPYSLYQ